MVAASFIFPKYFTLFYKSNLELNIFQNTIIIYVADIRSTAGIRITTII